ncbi:MAG: thioredoxin-dependent thiol peroxidase [Bacteroidota bacterium]|nr:MAG: thioredoxin-dependent thiol peroxidase [Bacteroidota bacterium]
MAFIEEGKTAPEFSGTNQKGERITLSSFRGKKVILYFYPKDNTPGCTAESCNLRDNYSNLLQKGFEVIGVSPDSEKSHAGFASKYELPFHLIADTDQKILKQYGAWGLKKMYGKEYEGVLRTTYVINEQSLVEKLITKVDTQNHSAQILQELGL